MENRITDWTGRELIRNSLERRETVETVLAHMAHILRFLDHLRAEMLLEMRTQIVQAIEDTIAHLAAHSVVFIGRT